MTREILFRGKTIDNKKWVYGYLERGTHWQSKKEILLIQHSLIESTQIIPETVTQFTGLLDKNGTKIFEGDKVKDEIGVREVKIGEFIFNDPEGIEHKFIGIYGVWDDDSISPFYANDKDLEIIGNIFEEGSEK